MSFIQQFYQDCLLKFAPMGGLPRSQRVRPSAASPVGSKVLYIKFRCEPRRIARPHKAQNGQTGTCRRGLKVQEDSLLVHRKNASPGLPLPV